jgi:putative transposase
VRLARALTRPIGLPGDAHPVIRENGTELTSPAILRWSQERQIEWHHIAPGRPMQNICFGGTHTRNADCRSERSHDQHEIRDVMAMHVPRS